MTAFVIKLLHFILIFSASNNGTAFANFFLLEIRISYNNGSTVVNEMFLGGGATSIRDSVCPSVSKKNWFRD